jgi:monofunctional glycosyltransferase
VSRTGTRARRRPRWRVIAIAAVALFIGVPILLVLPLRWIDPPATAFMLEYRHSGAERRPYDYQWVDWAQMSHWAPLAMVAAEDQKFPEHHGFDLDSIHDALNSGGSRLRGASTISQQTAKNLYLWPGRSFVRKGLEAYLTIFLELLWPKQRILEVYANVAELGPGVYGVEAASRRYYGKGAAQLGPREAALLAAVLPNPESYSVHRPSSYVRERSDWIERQMRALGGPGYLAHL